LKARIKSLLRRASAGSLHPAVALLAFAVLCRLIFLGARSLWFDEAKTLILAQASVRDLPAMVRALEGISPLYFLVLHGWVALFPDPLTAIRLFSALCGIAALAVFLPLCRKAAPGSWKTAFFIGCFSSFWVHLSQDGRVYAPLLLASLGQAYGLLALTEEWSVGRLLGYSLAGAAGLYLHPFSGFTFAAGALYGCAALRRRGAHLGYFLAAQAVAALLYAPWLSSLQAQMGRAHTSLLSEPLSWRQLALVAGTMLADLPFLSLAMEPWVRGLGLCALGLLAFGAFLRVRRARIAWDGPGAFCVFHAAAPLIMVRAAEWALQRPMTQPRYFVALSPFLYILIALSADELRSRWARRVIMALALCGAFAYHLVGHVVDPRLEEMGRHLRSLTRPGDVVVHLQPYYYLSLRYRYLPDREHRLLSEDDRVLSWDGLPGYAALMPKERLDPRQRYAVVDPMRTLFPSRIGAAEGRRLEDFACWDSPRAPMPKPAVGP